ncbi:MAG: tRNA (adenosine(37)-N6)-threonylcarbamoyltransferase complex transferase subunit TsaD [Desulfamplus sp.]|nr:tRNA (adenosine(37)-N6)-threonylcarbamoyltransferase complex transferase subunit TsaD [Desulfamplus sp.]
MIVLGIESSCDETAAAVVENGTSILSSIVSSQADVHHKYGGVVPELASRMHIEAILPVVNQAMDAAGTSLDAIDGVAATRGPGLTGALLVGFSFAKAFAWARGLPLAGVNHLEGHIHSVFLTPNPPEFPFVILLASGGHTNLYHVTSFDDFELMGQTRDDAAGEAFDKVAKMLGLGYPGGAVIEKLAHGGDPARFSFPKPFLEKDSFDFSFSGLKSAVARFIHEQVPDAASMKANIAASMKANIAASMKADIAASMKADITASMKADIAASFQESVVDVLSRKLLGAATARGVNHIAVAGGVAANGALEERLKNIINAPLDFFDHKKAEQIKGMTLHIPPVSLCGDNAAMIAARGYGMILDGRVCRLDHDVFSRTRI